MKVLIVLFMAATVIIGCTKEKKLSATQIIDNAIKHHGGNYYDTISTSFQFREKTYSLNHNKGLFNYKRIFTDSSKQILDILANSGFQRRVNDSLIKLSSKDSIAYANSVNSVLYFALLPYGLNHSAIIANLIERTQIEEKEYYCIKIVFKAESGGKDYQDEFMYWIDTNNFSVDYLAYNYETEGGGVRFRKAYNQRRIKGVLFQDYLNYKAPVGISLNSLPALYKKEQLTLLSKIELKF